MSDHTAPENILPSFKDTRVLVIGDIMLDRFVYGRVDRISPESPVPILNISREEIMLGGAGNTLANLAGLGVQADIVSLTGNAAEADMLADLIVQIGYTDAYLVRSPSRPTTVKTRFLAGHQQLLRSDFEDATPVSDKDINAALKHIKALLPKADAIVLSDYGKGLLTDTLIQNTIKHAKEHNIPVIVDPKGRDFRKYKGADIITPNRKELSDALNGIATKTDEDIINAAGILIQKCGIGTVFATRSAEGLSIVDAKSVTHFPGADIEVFDVSGAGDTVIATIAAAVGAGASYADAGRLANLAGSCVVTKVGTAPIRYAELAAAVEEDAIASGYKVKTLRADDKSVLDLKTVTEHVRRLRAKGRKIGFTNGCFDILHYGHVSYLAEAAKHCDILIVGMNSDSSVRILKGPTRPVHDEHSRAAVLLALSAVDMVVLFGAEKSGDDNTAISVLETLKPDVYFKGGDYTEDQIPEAPTVRANGGAVKIMPVYDGHSTTQSLLKKTS